MLRTIALFGLLFASFKLLAVQVIAYSEPARCGSNNGSIILNVAGTPPFTYAWSNGATTANIQGLAPGDYTVTVTDAGSSLDTTLVVDALFELRFIGSPEVAMVQNDCDNMCTGMAQISTNMLMGTEPYTFQLPPASEGGGMAIFAGLCAGNDYQISVTDANGCPGTVDLTNAVLAVSPSVVTVAGITPACDVEANGTITVVLDGIAASELQVSRVGGGYYQTHYPAWGIPYVINGLPAGDYDLTSAIPLLGCAHGYSATVEQLPAPCGSVSGKVYNDSDQDCAYVPGEYGLPYRVLTIEPGPSYAITDGAGDYYSASGFGTFTLAQPLVEESQICPPDAPVPFTIDAGSPEVVLDLADSSAAPLDTRVVLFPGPTRPGFPAGTHGTLMNNSTYPSAAITLTLLYDPLLDPVTISPTPTSASPGSVQWILPAMSPFAWFNFHVNGNVPPETDLLGTVIDWSASALDDTPEQNTANNSVSVPVTITGSLDPNDKQARTSSGLSSSSYYLDEDQFIDYTVRFQNTGTDTAFTVVVRDSLEAGLDPGSLEILGASHPFTPSFQNGRTLVFTFGNIQLADSATNEPASHGAVHYRIKPVTSVMVGETISNTAAIYFDYNPAVITNTSQLLVEMSTMLPEPSVPGRCRVFPNPVVEELRVTVPDDAHRMFSAEVVNIDGRVVLQERAFRTNDVLDLRCLMAGPYLLRLTDVHGTTLQAPFVKR